MAVSLLRPSILASLVVHGAAVVAGIAVAAGSAPSAPPHVLGFLEEPEGAFAAVEVPPPPPDEAPRDVPEVVERAVADAPPPPEEEPLPSEPADAAPPAPLPDAAVPVGARVPRRRAPVAVAPTAAPPVAPPSPAQPVAAAAPAGAARVTTFAKGHPTNRRPAYPEVARRAGWEGVATLIVEVREDGRVGAVSLEASSGHAVLDEAAIDAVRGWTYAPRLVDGVPARDLLRVPVRFELAAAR